MANGLIIYRTQVLPEWVDYNGHLRDAYYVLAASFAADALMDHLGIDAPYRERTHCTLYTLELHVHYFHEVKQTDLLEVAVRIIGADEKRIHAGFEVLCTRLPEPAASIELMLMHVEQGESVKAMAFSFRDRARTRGPEECDRRRRARQARFTKDGAARPLK